jgi:CheY-like chemotaxis protein
MLKILLVDDESYVSEVLQEILNRLGHHAETASGGQEGLLMFDSQPYDLVITDIRMPGIDGHGVAQHIRTSERPYTPIIGISGTPWFLDGETFDCVISKPFTVQALTDAIDDAIGHPITPHTLQPHPVLSMG